MNTHALGRILLASIGLLTLTTQAQTLTPENFRRHPTLMSGPDIRLRPRMNESIPLVVICMDYSDAPAVYSREMIDDMVFGPDPSVAGYYAQASAGRFAFTRAGQGVYGWYRAPLSNAEYLDEAGLASARGYAPGTTDGRLVRRSDTIVAAADDLMRDIDLRSLDSNGDRVISPDELAVFVVWGSRFSNLAAANKTYPNKLRLGDYELNIFVGATWEGRLMLTQGRLSPATLAHELAHTVFGLADLYPDGDATTEAPGPFSLMDQDLWLDGARGVPALDPWALFQLGWVNARVVTGGSTMGEWVTLGSVETTREILIVPIYGKGTSEYFIIENRSPTGYDAGFMPGSRGVDRGLGIWHFDETRRRPNGEWLRTALRLVRAVGPVPAANANVDNAKALFDASELSTGYDWFDRSAPRNSKTRSGEKTGIGVWRIPVASQWARFYLGTPYDMLATKVPLLQQELAVLERELASIPDEMRYLRQEWNGRRITRQAYLQGVAELNARATRLTNVLIPAKRREMESTYNAIADLVGPTLRPPPIN